MVIPRSYLPWMGAGLIVLGGLQFLGGRVRLGPSRYLRHGVPLVVRVVGLGRTPTLLVDGLPLYCALSALIEHRDPQSGELRSQQVKSPEFPADKKDDYTTTFQVGDYVTALYLPGEYPESLQLFEFLDLGPESGFPRCSRSQP